MTSPNNQRDGKVGRQKRKPENSPSPDDDGNQDGKGTKDRSQTSPDGPTPPSKKPKSAPRRSKDSLEPNYSDMVKKSMENTTRTNQACDRCKGRKMKCDSDPESCANCRASDTQCTHTHPITKTTWLRGEPERLRRENAILEEENARLRREITRRDELIRQLTDPGGMAGTGRNVNASTGHPMQGHTQPSYGMNQLATGYAAYSYGPGPGHTNPFQTTQSPYHQAQNYADSTAYLQNAGLTLPPIIQQQQQPHTNSYNPVTTTASTTGFDAITAPVTSAPAQATSQAMPSTLYAQNPDPQTDNNNGAGDGNGNRDESGEYQQKAWPY